MLLSLGHLTPIGASARHLAGSKLPLHMLKLICRAAFTSVLLIITPYGSCHDGNSIMQMAGAHDRAISGKGDTKDAVDAGKLIGFVSAVADGAIADGYVCLPPGVTYEQMVEVAKKSMRNMPAAWHMPAHTLIFAALLESFSCKRK